jgi:DNA polymerase
MDKITKCKKCGLSKNQKPLCSIPQPDNAEVIWVGLSAQKIKHDNEEPLDNRTNTGKIISEIENELPQIMFYQTNLVKCLPLGNDKKIRYPNKKEKTVCYPFLLEEIGLVKPKIVFLLGLDVAKFISKQLHINSYEGIDPDFHYISYKCMNCLWVPIHHPSYISIYKRKQKDKYMKAICQLILEED